MCGLLESFSESVRVREKHVEKTHIGLWGWLAILKSSEMLQVISEQTSPRTMWFGDEPNGRWWAFTPEADEDREWTPVHNA
jgi:hypothetical protein